MSKAVYWQRGETIDHTNATDATIEANTIVAFGSHIGVAGTDIAVGETGTLHVSGVFELPKTASEEISAGTDVYFANDAITATSGDVKAGYAIADAAADDATVKVRL
jgi:predicted RecA/RadA family phage recombinase